MSYPGLTRTWSWRVAAASLATGLLLAGCAGLEEPVPTATAATSPEFVSEALPSADTDGMWLPYQYQSLEFVQFDGAPATIRQLGGIFVALSHHDGISALEVIDSQGSLLWRIERQGEAVDFALTPSPQGNLLVVSDESGEVATVDAYELKTAKAVWESVEVPGKLTGPGLVWQEPDSKETHAIAPGTGEVLGADDFGGERILGQYQALVVTASPERMAGWPMTGAEGELPRWQLDAKKLDISGGTDCLETAVSGPPTASGGAATPPQTRPLTSSLAIFTCADADSDSAASAGALIDLASGRVLTEDAIAVTADFATKTRVVTKEGAVAGLDEAGKPLWKLPTAPGSHVSAAGSAMAYIRDESSIRAYNTLTGELAQAYDSNGSGEIAIPVLASATGATALQAGDSIYLATTNPSDNADPTEEG